MGLPESAADGVRTEQLSLFLGDTWVVSFYSGRADPFGAVRQRLRTADSRLRRNGIDYLYYSLLDTAIDLVFPQMEALGERIEALELTVFDDPNREAPSSTRERTPGVGSSAATVPGRRRTRWSRRKHGSTYAIVTITRCMHSISSKVIVKWHPVFWRFICPACRID